MDGNTDTAGDGEIEIDIQAISDDLLFELKKHVDKYLQEQEQNQQAKFEPSENEAVNVSGLSHSSTNPCKGLFSSTLKFSLDLNYMPFVQ
jgi:hypothetical protein